MVEEAEVLTEEVAEVVVPTMEGAMAMATATTIEAEEVTACQGMPLSQRLG